MESLTLQNLDRLPDASPEGKGGSYSPSPTSATPKITPETKVKLAMGTSTFIINAHLLMKHSLYFNNLLSERWVHGVKIDNGTVHIALDELDEDLCLHVMAYIRDGVQPIFYSQATGHDVPRYIHLLQHAQYFGVPNLVAWLKQQKYYEAVTHQYRLVHYYDNADTADAFNQTVDSRLTLQFHTIPSTKKIYVCPRRISVHRGRPYRCGHACERARVENGGERAEEDESILDVVVVSKEVHFHLDKCVEDRP